MRAACTEGQLPAQFSLTLLHFPALTTKMDACLPHVMRINKLTEHLLFASEFAGPWRQWQVRAGCSRNWQAGTTCDHLPPAPAPSVMFCTEWAFHQRWLSSTATTAESKGSYRWSTYKGPAFTELERPAPASVQGECNGRGPKWETPRTVHWRAVHTLGLDMYTQGWARSRSGGRDSGSDGEEGRFKGT